VSARRRQSDADESLGFEEALEVLDGLVGELEGGEQSLEQSLETFERGVKLVRLCSERLQSAQVRLQELEQAAAGPRERSVEHDEEEP
jgi:exodeoxyribonuclease VII small subunit